MASRAGDGRRQGRRHEWSTVSRQGRQPADRVRSSRIGPRKADLGHRPTPTVHRPPSNAHCHDGRHQPLRSADQPARLGVDWRARPPEGLVVCENHRQPAEQSARRHRWAPTTLPAGCVPAPLGAVGHAALANATAVVLWSPTSPWRARGPRRARTDQSAPRLQGSVADRWWR